MIFFGTGHLHRTVSGFIEPYHGERNHQGPANRLILPKVGPRHGEGPISCRERLGGLLYEGRMELVAPDERPWNQALPVYLAGAKGQTGRLPGKARRTAQELPQGGSMKARTKHVGSKVTL